MCAARRVNSCGYWRECDGGLRTTRRNKDQRAQGEEDGNSDKKFFELQRKESGRTWVIDSYLGLVGPSRQVDLGDYSCNLHREFTSFPHMRAAISKEALGALRPHLAGSSSHQ